MMRASSLVVSVALCLQAVPATVAAQLDTLRIPGDLAMVLLGAQGADSRIFIGGVPPAVQGRIPLGSAERVVGGMDRGARGTLVIQVSGSNPQAVADYVEHLEEQGWERPRTRRDLRGGFQSTGPTGSSVWCGEGYLIMPSSLTLDRRTYLRISYTNREEQQTVCDAGAGPMPPANPFNTLRFPDLEPPPGAVVRPRGGGGSNDAIDTEATVVSEMPLELIFEHYAQQLTAAGWAPEGRAVGDQVSIGRWRTQDDDGEPVVGTLTIWTLLVENTYRAVARMEREGGGLE